MKGKRDSVQVAMQNKIDGSISQIGKMNMTVLKMESKAMD